MNIGDIYAVADPFDDYYVKITDIQRGRGTASIHFYVEYVKCTECGTGYYNIWEDFVGDLDKADYLSATEHEFNDEFVLYRSFEEE